MSERTKGVEVNLTDSGLGWVVRLAASESPAREARIRTVTVGENMVGNEGAADETYA